MTIVYETAIRSKSDSSCWVEFYRPGGNALVQEAVVEALKTGQAATCAMVKNEILGYVNRPREYGMISRDFEALCWLESGSEECDAAVDLGRVLRRKGKTVPPADLQIAGVALSHGEELLHFDRHFEAIAEASPALRHRYAGS